MIMFKAAENNRSPKISRNSNLNQHFGSDPFFHIQTKLSVGSTNYSFEREADAAANKVVNGSKSNAFGSVDTFFPSTAPIQRKKQEEPGEEIQKKSSGSQSSAPAHVESTLKSTKGSGNSLKGKARTEMERGFGADFSNVKIHSNSNAAKMNNELGAQTFTNGNDIYFNSGKYNPASKEGKHLLAHELTHTIQQKSADVHKKGANLKSPRFRGDLTLENALDGISFVKFGSLGTSVVLLQQALTDSGFPLPKFGADGKFGSETNKAVKDYQKANALSADGVIGPNTMAALDLYYSVDLSTVVSKYIGETEKNLSNLFNKAANKDWILFFDEADAIFGKRTNVRDAHDKYANQEVSYLLQRVETHPGLIILASNFRDNIDDAFTRRFQSIIAFEMPGQRERAIIWKTNLPEKLQISKEIDWEEISKKYEFTGSNILNIIQFCCLKVLSGKSEILTPEILNQGIKREFVKENRTH